MVAIAILDDYQQVALQMADWSRLQENHRITVFSEPFADEMPQPSGGPTWLPDARANTVSRGLIERLPTFAAIDIAAAAKERDGCGPSPGHPTAEPYGVDAVARGIFTQNPRPC